MKKLAAILLTVVLTLAAASTAAAHTRRHRDWYIPRAHHACRTHYRRTTVRVDKTRRVRRHGRIVRIRVRHHGRLVKVRQVRCVRRAAKKTNGPVTITPTQPAPPTLPAPITARANIDPTFTQDPSDNLKVTWDYSASGNGNPLPAGTLSLSVSEPNAVGPSGGCTMNVDATTTGGTCTVELPNYGSWSVTVTYTGSSANVTPATATDTETIEPLPATIAKTWGTDSPTNGPSIAATVIGSSASVTLTDGSFEGATSVGISDQNGDSCNATVSGTTASCTMQVGATPTSFTVNYPGGTSTQSTQNVSPGGTQQVTTTWPAQTAVNVPNPSVTVQQATVEECGGYQADGPLWNPNGTTPGCGPNPGHGLVSGQWPNPVTVATDTRVEFDAAAIGSLNSDQNPTGYLTYTITGPAAPSMEYDQDYGSPNGSEDCSVVENYGNEAVGGCLYTFSTPGVYTLTLSYTSQDANYADSAMGYSEMIDVQ